jgi:hypothetical protein
VSPASFKIMLDGPEAPPPPPSKPVNPAALTREERHNNSWHVRFIAWVLGLPSILSIGFVCCVGLYYANVTTEDALTRLALSVGILVITLFTAGLPIGAALNRETEPAVAKAAFGFWIACFVLDLAVMGNFAWHRPEAASPVAQAPARASVSVPHLSAAEAERLDWDIAGLWYTLTDLDEEMHGPRRERFGTPQNRQLYAAQYAQLQQLETKRYGAPVILKEIGGELEFQGYAAADEPAAIAAPTPAPGLDLAAVAMLMLTGAALGLLISASSLAAILTEKAATVRVEAEAAPQSAPLPLAVYHPGESADGFEHWALSCVSKLSGAPPLQSGDAHAHYLSFCARNDFQATLPNQEFGRRLRAWMMNTFGIDGRHSGSAGGTVYDGVTLAPLGPSITAPAMNGGA